MDINSTETPATTVKEINDSVLFFLYIWVGFPLQTYFMIAIFILHLQFQGSLSLFLFCFVCVFVCF